MPLLTLGDTLFVDFQRPVLRQPDAKPYFFTQVSFSHVTTLAAPHRAEDAGVAALLDAKVYSIGAA